MLCSIAISATLREICKKKCRYGKTWGTDLWNKRIELLQRVNCVGDIRHQNYIVAAICLVGLISPLPCTATRKLPRSSGAVVMTNYTASIMTTAAIHKIILREAEVCWWRGWLHNWENCWEFIPLSSIEMYIWSQELPRWCNRALWWSVLSVPSLLKICKDIGYCSAPYGFCIYVLKVNCGCTLQVAFKQVRSLLSMQEKILSVPTMKRDVNLIEISIFPLLIRHYHDSWVVERWIHLQAGKNPGEARSTSKLHQ